jgi:hypothetical protein
MGPTQPPAQKSEAFLPEVKLLGHEADHSTPSNARKIMKGGIPPLLHIPSRHEKEKIYVYLLLYCLFKFTSYYSQNAEGSINIIRLQIM